MPEPDNIAADKEIILQSGEMRLRVSPYGASLRGLWRESDGAEIVTGYSGAKNKVGGQGDVLIPFPGRVGGGRYPFDGQVHELTKNDKDGPNAIHGFLRTVSWQTSEQREDAATFAITLAPEANPGYPFALRATVTYTVQADGMTCQFAVENSGDQSAPVAAGFHPYFTVGTDLIDTATLHLPMAAMLKMVNLIPTGQILPVAGTPLDFREARPIGQTTFNTCFLQPLRDADGVLRIQLSSAKRSVIVWMDQAINYVVLYSGDPLPEPHRRRSLAIEPMTCGSDAFNHPQWGLKSLAPGEVLSGSWGVTVSGS